MPQLILDCVGYGQMTAESNTTYDNALRNESNEILVQAGISASSGDRGVIFKGKFQEADTLNKNRRIYPRNVLESAINYIRPAIEERRLVGELDHPDTPTVKWKEASHIITKLWWEGNSLMGEGETLPTPWGMVLENVLRRKIKVGISSRGVGDGKMSSQGLIISDGFKMVTWDIVVDPSTSKAFLESTEQPINVEEIVKIESSRVDNIDYNRDATMLIGALLRSKLLRTPR